MHLDQVPTPALLVDSDALEGNLATMAAALPGKRLRPHVKAHKCTSLGQTSSSGRSRGIYLRDDP